LHSVGAGNGMTLTAVGQLSGNTGAGTFNRSDGYVGRWIVIKHSGQPPSAQEIICGGLSFPAVF
jgi:hypothetical protein